ncbi:hypothetical protein [Cupriavidus sp. AcVe19-6a]|uniref:hypothetical protein n=1 Tax=Cupriavidus sp. AcVe19-6a TaxID=2821358 RepID=UPI00352D044D
MAAAGYGHATFFLWSQQHAGEARAAAMASAATNAVPQSAVAPSRPLSAITADRAKVVTALAAAEARRCTGDCTVTKIRLASLAATQEALTAEVEEARRRQVAEDWREETARRETARREAVRHDPVMTALAAWLGITPDGVEFLRALVLASALEGVACYGWFLALAARVPPVTESITDSQTVPTAAELSLTGAVFDHDTDTAPVTSSPSPSHAEPEPELDRLHRAIAAGQLRPTVAEIRRHLGCSQAKASALRRQLMT